MKADLIFWNAKLVLHFFLEDIVIDLPNIKNIQIWKILLNDA